MTPQMPCRFASGSRAILLCGLALSGASCAGNQSGAPSARVAIHRWEDPARDAWSQPDKVVDALALGAKPLFIVDLGAGSGYFSRRLAKANPKGEVLALEVSRAFRSHIESNKEAWGTPNLKTRLVINNNPLLRDASVDLVFMSNTYRFLEHRPQYFGDLRASLKPGGKIAIVDFRKDRDCTGIPECPPPRERVSTQDLVLEMKEAGFSLTADHNFLKYQYFLEFQVQDAKPASAVKGTSPDAQADLH